MAQSLMFWEQKDEISTEEAMERLQNLQELLSNETDYLEKKIDAETKTALEKRATNKRAALQALRRRKRYEKLLTQVDETAVSLEVQLEALTSATVDFNAANRMRIVAEALKSTFSSMTVGKVADLGDRDDRMEDVEAIGIALAQPLGGEEVDDHDLLAELEEMDIDDLIHKPTDIQLPSVPTEELKTKDDKKSGKVKEEEEEGKETRKLSEWT